MFVNNNNNNNKIEERRKANKKVERDGRRMIREKRRQRKETYSTAGGKARVGIRVQSGEVELDANRVRIGERGEEGAIIVLHRY